MVIFHSYRTVYQRLTVAITTMATMAVQTHFSSDATGHSPQGQRGVARESTVISYKRGISTVYLYLYHIISYHINLYIYAIYICYIYMLYIYYIYIYMLYIYMYIYIYIHIPVVHGCIWCQRMEIPSNTTQFDHYVSFWNATHVLLGSPESTMPSDSYQILIFACTHLIHFSWDILG